MITLTCTVTGMNMGTVHAADATGRTLCGRRLSLRSQGPVWEGPVADVECQRCKRSPLLGWKDTS